MSRVKIATNRPLAEPVGEHAAVGASWMMLQTMATRALLFVTQIILARLLKPEDYSPVGMAQSSVVFFALLQPSILSEILIQRQRHFRRWANSIFWMSMAESSVLFLAALIAAPIAALFVFNVSSVMWLVLILGSTTFLGGIYVVWLADLSIHFRFRLIATITLVGSIITAVLTVILAKAGAGPYSLLVPQAVAALCVLVPYAASSDFRPKWHLQLRRWRYLVGDTLYLGGWAFLSLVTLTADKFFLGIFHKETMGIYVWAYSLSLQFVQLVAASLRSALLPTFGRIKAERERLGEAFLQIANLGSFLAMPLCVLLVPAMPGFIRTVFSSRWDDSAQYVQILLPSMGFVVTGAAAGVVMQARRQFKRGLIIYGVNALTFVVAVGLAAAFGGLTAVAIAVSVQYALGALGISLAANAPMPRQTMMRIVGGVLWPFVNAAASAAATWALLWKLGWNPWTLSYAMVSLAAGTVFYFLATLLFMRARLRLAIERLRPVVSRLMGRRRQH